MKPKGERYRIAVDFDGVIHQYTSPWQGAATIPDPPVPGAIEWAFEMIQKFFDIAITSTRNHQAGGIKAMREWLRRHALNRTCWRSNPLYGYRGLEEITFPIEKPAALVYLDDRAMRFDGEHWPTASEIHAARPWNKR